mmetsp:Transcript_425/g.1633  ORF Transcript_425/g.1633 Transcript_425/m.1633 type:complete len:278 (+) Transcript_425:278-1111(+)
MSWRPAAASFSASVAASATAMAPVGAGGARATGSGFAAAAAEGCGGGAGGRPARLSGGSSQPAGSSSGTNVAAPIAAAPRVALVCCFGTPASALYVYPSRTFKSCPRWLCSGTRPASMSSKTRSMKVLPNERSSLSRYSTTATHRAPASKCSEIFFWTFFALPFPHSCRNLSSTTMFFSMRSKLVKLDCSFTSLSASASIFNSSTASLHAPGSATRPWRRCCMAFSTRRDTSTSSSICGKFLNGRAQKTSPSTNSTLWASLASSSGVRFVWASRVRI